MTPARTPRYSVGSAAASLRNGDLSCVDLLNSCLAQIDRHDEQVRAWVTVDREGALRQAHRRDEELAAGRDRGSLHGIPITVKDVIDVADLPTQAGSPLRADHVAAGDAASVSRLRAAGAVIMGKSVTTQFAFDDPPSTRNPWRLTRTPGGSSSGPAAAVAAGMSLAGLGTQTGGSLLRPASYCGLAAVKPTWGRVSVFGVVPLAFNLDHVGAIAADCTGLAAALDALAAGGHSDPFTSDVPPLNCTRTLATPAEPPRIGVLGGFFRDGIDDDVAAVFGHSVEKLRAAGASVTSVEPPTSIGTVPANNRNLLAMQAAFAHREHFPAQRSSYSPLIAGLLDDGLGASLADLPGIFLHRDQFQRGLIQAMSGLHVLLTATTATTAPDVSTTGRSVFNAPFSYAGFPAVTLPAGLDRDGLPIGLQLIGRPWEEEALLRTSFWVEQLLGFHAQPDLLNA